MKKATSIIMISILLMATSCEFVKTHNPLTKKAREAEALKKQQEEFRIADSLRLVEEQASRDREAQAEQARIAEQDALAQSKYHIIVGSFLTPEYATTWLDHITQLGYTPRLIEMDGGRWKLVSVNSYQTLNEAWNALRDYQSNVQVDAWIFKPE
jgi:cell division protein FtsN